jgi:formylglycine-generating enzyme required for sulfatase activity
MAQESAEVGLKKYIYGFGRNDIDPTWANYKPGDRPIQHFQVLTTPVGFYNGVNSLPLTMNSRQQTKTNLAKSPYGAFDMSGNVWEWVADWYSDNYASQMDSNDPKVPNMGTKKVVKGGCYDSLAEGVQVTERLGLEPEHADAYTGFRIAK